MFLSWTASHVTDLLVQTSDLAETKEEPGPTDTSEKMLWRPLMKQEEPLKQSWTEFGNKTHLHVSKHSMSLGYMNVRKTAQEDSLFSKSKGVKLVLQS